jgi:hypothetical protein
MNLDLHEAAVEAADAIIVLADEVEMDHGAPRPPCDLDDLLRWLEATARRAAPWLPYDRRARLWDSLDSVGVTRAEDGSLVMAPKCECENQRGAWMIEIEDELFCFPRNGNNIEKDSWLASSDDAADREKRVAALRFMCATCGMEQMCPNGECAPRTAGPAPSRGGGPAVASSGATPELPV